MTIRQTLTLENCKAMMAQMSVSDKLLFASLLTMGDDVRTWTWEDVMQVQLDMPVALFELFSGYITSRGYSTLPTNYYRIGFHWINNVPLRDAVWAAKGKTGVMMSMKDGVITREKVSAAQPYGTHEITRRFKRYARKAGVNKEIVSLRTVINTHKLFSELYSNSDEIAEALGLKYSSEARTAALEWPSLPMKKALVRGSRLRGIGRRSTSASTVSR